MESGTVWTASSEELGDMEGQVAFNGRRPARGIAQFELAEVLNKATGKMVPVEYVDIIIPGDPTSSPRKKVTDGIRKLYAREYQQFRSGLEVTGSGTPIGQWPMIKPSQARALAAANIFTVEDLADVPDANLGSIPFGRTLQNQAKEFLENKKAMDIAKAGAKQADEMREGFDVAQAQIEALKAEIAAMKTPKAEEPEEEPVKRSPGRPRKDAS